MRHRALNRNQTVNGNQASSRSLSFSINLIWKLGLSEPISAKRGALVLFCLLLGEEVMSEMGMDGVIMSVADQNLFESHHLGA